MFSPNASPSSLFLTPQVRCSDMFDEWAVHFPVDKDNPSIYTLPERTSSAHGNMFVTGSVKSPQHSDIQVNARSQYKDLANVAPILVLSGVRPALSGHRSSTSKSVTFNVPDDDGYDTKKKRRAEYLEETDTVWIRTSIDWVGIDCVVLGAHNTYSWIFDHGDEKTKAAEGFNIISGYGIRRRTGCNFTGSNVPMPSNARLALMSAAYPSYLEAESWKLYRKDHYVQWFHSHGDKPIFEPCNMDPATELQPGDLFVHAITGTTGITNAVQIWVFGIDNDAKAWTAVHKLSAVRHPLFSDLVLSYGMSDKHPKWIVHNTMRREKGEMFTIYIGM
ncbi:hypothetical protein LXA43DRAFT_1067247 [Ganoderma leucocontextum]|nr:hypothetical protein LXA43DRAFT_1067247 [Ganoderma leucocontextum]